MRRGEWMTTFTGKRFYALDPRADEVDIRDVAHALANTCRFGGHCPRYYSVAEHSVLVSRQGQTPIERIWGLLHDAAEAYVGDVVRPLKQALPEFVEIEQRVLRVIAERFDLPWPPPPEVKIADDLLLAAEAEALFGIDPADWGLRRAEMQGAVEGLPPAAANAAFLAQWAALRGNE